jgi:hypothetical protein
MTVLVALVTGCSGTESTFDDAAPEAMPEPGFGHVHGLGVNPADGVLYAATHYGVWRVPTDGRPVRIADRYQDTMGFTVAGPDHFLGSGHPDPRENLPSHLGLIESRDRAETWKPLSLLGEADFHALEARHGRIYGYDSTSSTFMISSDGRTWQHLAQAGLLDFTVAPSQPDVVLGTSEQGLVRSDDSGGSFTPVAGAPRLAFIDWSQGGLYGVDATGVVWTSSDGGTRWERRADAGSQPGALIVTEDSQIFTATEDGIVTSTDAARTFTTVVNQSSGGG